MSNRKVQWRGATGNVYEYEIHGMDFNPQPGDYGNYIFARETPIGWYAVYIGQGELETRIRKHPTGKKASMRASHIHVHINNNDAQTRLAEAKDLRAAHNHASTTILFRPN
ncbi:MAG: hypothetical protein KGJ56_01585 [Gammaproteobacteria bacterium]|nr:hypothetical protein [Gammaproteobacteria bacterium]